MQAQTKLISNLNKVKDVQRQNPTISNTPESVFFSLKSKFMR